MYLYVSNVLCIVEAFDNSNSTTSAAVGVVTCFLDNGFRHMSTGVSHGCMVRSAGIISTSSGLVAPFGRKNSIT